MDKKELLHKKYIFGKSVKISTSRVSIVGYKMSKQGISVVLHDPMKEYMEERNDGNYYTHNLIKPIKSYNFPSIYNFAKLNNFQNLIECFVDKISISKNVKKESE